MIPTGLEAALCKEVHSLQVTTDLYDQAGQFLDPSPNSNGYSKKTCGIKSHICPPPNADTTCDSWKAILQPCNSSLSTSHCGMHSASCTLWILLGLECDVLRVHRESDGLESIL